MKKLMIALCAVAMAVGAQAGSIKWAISANGAKGYTGTAEATLAKGATVYFLLSSDMDNVTTALKNGQDFSSYILDSGATTGSAGVKTAVNVTSEKLPLIENPVGSGIYDGVSTDFRILVISDVGDDKWYKFSGALPKDTYWEGAETPTPTTVSFTSTSWGKGTEWAKAGTGPSPIPEPTSGLLLLLGVAGLALKRKRA